MSMQLVVVLMWVGTVDLLRSNNLILDQSEGSGRRVL
jgi:hypothetical protein